MGANETTMDVTGERELVITRTFAAPARIVFEAWTQPELVKKWWAPKSHGVVVASAEADVRPGGRYRRVLSRNGEEMAFSGTYIEVTPPTKIVYAEIFEPMRAAGEVHVTVTFEESNGHTKLVAHEVYPSKLVLEQVLKSGMEHGMRETMEQLAALVAV